MDVSLLFDNVAQSGILRLRDGDLRTDSDLRTSILISLFSDARATDDDQLPTQDDDRRGWVGNVFSEVPIGSRLWLLDRSVLTDEVIRRAKDYVIEALHWMIEKNIVECIEVEAERLGTFGAVLNVALTRNKKTIRYELTWNQEKENAIGYSNH